jgi:hypothetical protein
LEALQDGIKLVRSVLIDRIECFGHLILVVALEVTLEGLHVKFTA